jgi:DNA invertase Pin-like site-specific DNA recombinase
MSNSLIYTRVSTSDQKTERQLKELLDLTGRDQVSVTKIIKEKISGTKPLFKRKEGAQIEEMVKSGEINSIYVHEISRLGRNVADVATTIEFLIKHKCNLRVMDAGLSLFRDGEIDIAARMVINVLVSLAQNERDLLSQRTRSGMAHAKSQGKQIGRSKTEASTRAETLLKNGESVKNIVLETGLDRSYIYKLKKKI